MRRAAQRGGPHALMDAWRERSRAHAADAGAVCTAQRQREGPPRVLVVDADRALLDLIAEWLAAQGCEVEPPAVGGGAPPARVDLVVVDIPFPRRGGSQLLRQIAAEHPGTPIIALSSNFFPGIDSSGALARELGVARVLPMPVAREALAGAVRELVAT